MKIGKWNIIENNEEVPEHLSSELKKYNYIPKIYILTEFSDICIGYKNTYLNKSESENNYPLIVQEWAMYIVFLNRIFTLISVPENTNHFMIIDSANNALINFYKEIERWIHTNLKIS